MSGNRRVGKKDTLRKGGVPPMCSSRPERHPARQVRENQNSTQRLHRLGARHAPGPSAGVGRHRPHARTGPGWRGPGGARLSDGLAGRGRPARAPLRPVRARSAAEQGRDAPRRAACPASRTSPRRASRTGLAGGAGAARDACRDGLQRCRERPPPDCSIGQTPVAQRPLHSASRARRSPPMPVGNLGWFPEPRMTT